MYSNRVYICSIPTYSLRPPSSAKSLSPEASCPPFSTRVGNGSTHPCSLPTVFTGLQQSHLEGKWGSSMDRWEKCPLLQHRKYTSLENELVRILHSQFVERENSCFSSCSPRCYYNYLPLKEHTDIHTQKYLHGKKMICIFKHRHKYI